MHSLKLCIPNWLDTNLLQVLFTDDLMNGTDNRTVVISSAFDKATHQMPWFSV